MSWLMVTLDINNGPVRYVTLENAYDSVIALPKANANSADLV